MAQPIPAGARGNPITSSNFEAPFETPIFPYGVGGLDLASPLDRIAVGRFSRLTNLQLLPNGAGALQVRPGMTELATGTGNFHSVARLSDPETLDYTYIWGVGTDVAIGQSGAVTVLEGGFSNEPLTLVPFHPTLSAEPWMFVADRNQMRKIRFDGLILPFTPDTPTVAAVCALDTENRTSIADFASADGSAAADWTFKGGARATNALHSRGFLPTGDADDVAGGGVNFTLTPYGPSLNTEMLYWATFGLAKSLNLSVVGSVDAADPDAIQIEMTLLNPSQIEEVRLYLICSPVFSSTVFPGTVPEAGPPGSGGVTANTDFFLKAFRPDDFSTFTLPAQGAQSAAGTAQPRYDATRTLDIAAETEGFGAVAGNRVQRVDSTFMDSRDPARARAVQVGAANQQMVPLGTIGIPLRRGDFRRYGNTAGCDWATITGLMVYISTKIPADSPNNPDDVGMTLNLWALTGGSGPDTMDPATQSYDYRYTNYDPRTGDESNPSPEMADADWIDAIRRGIAAAPAAHGDSEMRQRFYRRGGILPDDWYFVGVNESDGGTLIDGASDLEIAAAPTLELDNYAPVPVADDDGTTLLGNPCAVLLGPYNNGQLFAFGNPHAPGTIFACKPGEPDHWPPNLAHEVCPPSEELMNGVMLGQLIVWSRESCYIVYPNLLGPNGMSSAPAGCTRGLQGRWALTLMGGVAAFVSEDGVFVTSGGPEECISDDIAPLFRGETVNGYLPIDLTEETSIRLAYFNRELYFVYREPDEGRRQVLVYSPETKQWRSYQFADNVVMAYNDEQGARLIYGLADRASVAEGTTDNGEAIEWLARTGSWDWGRPREEKLFGDQILDMDGGGIAISLQNFLNTEGVTNPPQAIPAFSGRRRVILDSFGVEPQRGRNLAVEVSGEGSGPILYQIGTSLTPQPDITINRVTNWDDLGHPDPSWVMGVTLDCNTSGEDRTIYVERDYLGTRTTVATLTVNHDGRHKKQYSWPAVPANQVRLRPDNDCGAWLCFRADWISYPEPPAIAHWDSYFENAWDQYITGLDLHIDTYGLEKTIVVEVDGVILTNPETLLPNWTVTAAGKQVVHLTLPTFPPLRGHVLRFYATDANPGQLYDRRWHTVVEPSEQHNWNQPFSIFGTQADKYLKALIFEIDTFGEDKEVAIEVDGVVVDTLTVNADGRKVVQIAFPQVLGRVYRIIPTDSFPSRLYSLRPVFDEEPFALARWETQELDHGLGLFQTLIEAQVTLKSTAVVTLTITTHTNQLGATRTDSYEIPSTGGAKQMRFVPFLAMKGVLFKYVLTSPEPFWLYKEESHVVIQPFVGGQPATVHVWGNSDTDQTRSMVNSTLAAGRDGGGT